MPKDGQLLTKVLIFVLAAVFIAVLSQSAIADCMDLDLNDPNVSYQVRYGNGGAGTMDIIITNTTAGHECQAIMADYDTCGTYHSVNTIKAFLGQLIAAQARGNTISLSVWGGACIANVW
jgi:hypothetical protein